MPEPTPPISTFPRQNARTQRFTLGHPRNIAVSADAGRVLFLRSPAGDDPVTALWSLDVATGDETLIADPADLLDIDGAELPAAERARRERAREAATGITSFATDRALARACFALAGRVYVADAASGAAEQLDSAAGAFDPRPDPTGVRVAYVAGDALHLTAPGDGHRVLVAEPDNDTVSWGSAEFIAAEEMGRGRGFWWSPDGDRLVVARVDVAPVGVWHVADPALPASPPTALRYPAAGTANADVTLWFVTLAGDRSEIVWDSATYPYLADVQWAPGAPLTLVVQSRDQRREAVLVVDDEGRTEIAAELTDPDWVELVAGTPAWIDGSLLTVRESSGTRALMLDDRMLSPADVWVRAVVDASASRVLFTASRTPRDVQLFSVTLDDGAVEELSDVDAVTGAAADGDLVVTTTSTPDRGPVTAVRGGPVLVSHRWDPDLDITVDVFDAGERNIPTAVLFPSEGPEGPLPVLCDPYGGPHAQRVVSSRPAFASSQWFADQGFAVVVADGRGTPGRGGGWERAVRGDLAHPVLEDQVAALHAAAERHPGRLDLGRVGIRGWSFGGYLAALAVLVRPDVFHAAVAGAPVTDWALYDTHYTERYLGHPDEEPDNYQRTSLLALAPSLRRPLLLIHGLADDNVVAAHTIQLSSALLAAGRPHQVLPLSGVTHMTPQEEVAENLLLLQVEFLRRSLADPATD